MGSFNDTAGSYSQPHAHQTGGYPGDVVLPEQGQNADSLPSEGVRGINLDAIRLPQNFAEITNVRKLVITIPVGKPDRMKFFRIHPDPSFQIQVATIVQKSERETYLVMPGLLAELAGEYQLQQLFVGITRPGSLFVWPVALPSLEGRTIAWHESARQAAALATEKWIRLVPNMDVGYYDILQAQGELPEPEWPGMAMSEIVDIAFKGKVIQNPDHPVVQQLRGFY